MLKSSNAPVVPADRLALRAGTFTLHLAPAAGGSIAGWWSDWPDGRHLDWLRPAAPGISDPLAMGCFPMAPFCNRMRHGRADVGGRSIRLPAHPETPPHALHGLVWQQPWQVVGRGEYWAELRQVNAGGAWPWRYTAVQRLELHATRGLRMTLALRNDDTAPMPAGVGFHPYFPRRNDARIRLEAAAVWENDAQRLPTVLKRDTPVLKALAAGVAADAHILDHNFTGWPGRATVEWPAENAAMEIVSGAPLNHVVLLTPRQRPFFCIEPVSSTTDWIHEAGRGMTEVGGTWLAPRETLAGWVRLVPLLTEPSTAAPPAAAPSAQGTKR